MKINLGLVLIHILNPLIGLLVGIRNFSQKQYRILILLFCLFFSYTYIPVEDSDAVRYEERISQINDYSFEKYFSDLTQMYNTESLYKDAYVYTMFFIVGKFTNEPRVFRLCFGFVYFSIFLLLIYNVFSLAAKGYKIYLIGLIFLLNFSSGLNGVRWPLSLMVYLLGIILFVKTKKLKYVFLSLVSFLIHFISYFFIPFLLLYVFTRKYYNAKTVLILVVLVALIGQVIVSGLLNNANFLGSGIEETTNGYLTNETFQEERAYHLQTLNWYVVFNRFSTYYFGLLTLLISILLGKKLVKDEHTLNLEYFSVLMFLASMLSSTIIDPISNRYYLAANGIVLVYLFRLTSLNRESLFTKIVNIVYVPILTLCVLLILRADLYTISPNIFVGNWLVEMFYSYEEGIQTIFAN